MSFLHLTLYHSLFTSGPWSHILFVYVDPQFVVYHDIILWGCWCVHKGGDVMHWVTSIFICILVSFVKLILASPHILFGKSCMITSLRFSFFADNIKVLFQMYNLPKRWYHIPHFAGFEKDISYFSTQKTCWEL
jgi:hypothetical protein